MAMRAVQTDTIQLAQLDAADIPAPGVLPIGDDDSGTDAGPGPSSLFGVPEVEHISLERGKHTVRGRMRLRAPAASVYALLSDYANCQRVFSNIAASEVRHCPPGEGGGLEVTQTCRWSFLAFSGTFRVALRVSEDPAAGVLLFRLLQSNFMRDFEGRWTVTPGARSGGSSGNGSGAGNGREGGEGRGGGQGEGGAWCDVEHLLSVVPSVPMPPPVAYYTRSIFVRQVEGILEDLRRGVEAAEAEAEGRRAAGAEAEAEAVEAEAIMAGVGTERR